MTFYFRNSHVVSSTRPIEGAKASRFLPFSPCLTSPQLCHHAFSAPWHRPNMILACARFTPEETESLCICPDLWRVASEGSSPSQERCSPSQSNGRTCFGVTPKWVFWLSCMLLLHTLQSISVLLYLGASSGSSLCYVARTNPESLLRAPVLPTHSREA